MSEWIRVDDRLPCYGDYSVVVAHENGSVEMCHVDDLRYSNGYTHWMPLPEPPEEK